MHRRSLLTQQRGDLDATMTPMIDVVFLLLIFFVWTASFQIVERVLPGNVAQQAGTAAAPPDQPPPPQADFDEIVVRIFWREGRPAWQVNDIPLPDRRSVVDRLRRIAEIQTEAPVILHPDPQVPLGDAIEIYDQARLAGFSKVAFAATEAEAG